MKINTKNMMISSISVLFGASVMCLLFGVFPYVLGMSSFWVTCGAGIGGLYVALKLINKSDK